LGQFALVRHLGPCLAGHLWLCGICLFLRRSKFALPFDKKKQERKKIIYLVGAAVAALKPREGILVGVQ
jgi:hypothetical protein